MRGRSLLLLVLLLALAGTAPAWAGGRVVVSVGHHASSSVIVVSSPTKVIVVQPPVTVIVPTRAAVIVPFPFILRQPCDFPVNRFAVPAAPVPAFLILGVTPVVAEVFVDGIFISTADQLVTRAVSLSPGRHALQIVSPGFRPWSAEVMATRAFPTRLHVSLTPE